MARGDDIVVEIDLVEIENPDELNLILGQSHFIKTAEDVHEAMVGAVPGVMFGVAFSEASMDRLVRTEGTDPELVALAARNLERIASGHTFIVFMRDSFPINFLDRIKAVPEVCSIFCATANPVKVVVARDEQGGGILGVIDGYPPLGVEGEEDRTRRRGFLRKIGYKLG
jgi:adenosine/AMP kinase